MMDRLFEFVCVVSAGIVLGLVMVRWWFCDFC
jgi:hypothetical protein